MKASTPLFCRRLILPVLLSLFFFSLSPSPAVRAQGTCISLASLGSEYSQDFNTLAYTSGSSTNALTIPGWYLHESGTSTRNNGLYAAGSGSDNTGDTYSFGADGSTERALGGLRVGALIPTFGACFTNNTGSTLTRLNAEYTGEEWRLGTAARTDQINFEYSPNATSLTTGTWTSIPALDFTTPDTGTEGAKNGNTAGEHTTLSATITGLSITNGTTFWIRWTDDNASGSDDGLAIDDFSLTPLAGTLLNVTNVSSTSLNGAYTIGDILSITVTFSQPVYVTGTPQLTLETGAADRVVNYTGGSGTATLTFDYTVQVGDTSADLDYVNTGSLTAAGGTIRDGINNDANLTLAAPGAPGSLGASKDIVIDTTPPNVTINQAAGQADPTNVSPVNFAVQFTENVADFATGDVTFGGTAGPTTVNVSGGPANYNVAVSGMTTPGTVAITIAANAAHDAAGNGNTASKNIDNTITITFNTTNGLVSSNLSALVGETVTFTATVTSAAGTPTGNVEFREGALVLGTGALNAGGQATFSTNALALGTHNITAYYLGDGGHNPSTSGTVSQQISAADTTATIATGSSPSGFGAPVTFTATVTVVMPGTGTPTGNVEFFDGATSLGTGALGVGGQATLTTSALTTGTHTITARYGGDTNFNSSTSPGIIQTVNGPPSVDHVDSNASTIFPAPDNALIENEHAGVAITQLLAIFSKDMNAADAGTAGNYHLVMDDSPVDLVNSATYNNLTFTTTLNINGGVALPNGRYTLTVSGSLRDTLGAPMGTDFVRYFYVDNGHPHHTSVATLPDNNAITNGATVNVRFASINIAFDEDLNDPAGNTDPDDVTNPQNYLLVSPGPNNMFDTSSCALGLAGDDGQIPTGPVTYNNRGGAGPFVATVQLNGGTALANGRYQLYICGTTSLVDLALNSLNNSTDELVTFNVLTTSPTTENPLRSVKRNPVTGFAPGLITVLPEQPAEKAYTHLGALWIEIPRLDLKTEITGVPLVENGWDVTWLNRQVGWLEGTAYPTWEGNTVLTAHAYTADGEAGPFALLKILSYGENIIIHLGGMKYTYAVRTNLLTSPNDTRWLTRHEKLDWITLITCQQYDEKTKSYRYRRVVRAVLISVEKE